MQDYTVERVGKPDLAFTGELIGQSDASTFSPIPNIRIYRTKAGKFVAALAKDPKRSVADHFEKPAEVLNWLKVSAGGSINPDAQAAIEQACSKDADFKSFWTEHVD